MASDQEKNQSKVNESPTAAAEQKKITEETKTELAPLQSKVELGILEKEITQDKEIAEGKKTSVGIETDFSSINFDKIPTLPEEKAKFELFQKETFILLHQLVGLNDTVISPEDLKLKAGGLFFDPAFQQNFALSEKARVLHSKLQTLYGYLLTGTDAQKQNANLIFTQWNTLIDQIQTGVKFAAKISNDSNVLQKKESTLPTEEKSLWDKIMENKNTIMTTAAIGIGVVGALTFVSKLFGGNKEKSEGGGFWKWLIGGGAVLGAVGLTVLSGKNPLEMVTSFFGDKALKVVLENTLKPLLGEDLTNTLVKKLDGKVTPEEFTKAYQKDGLKGVGQLLIEKKIDFTEEEKKKIAEKFGLPEAVTKLLPTTGTVSNTTASSTDTSTNQSATDGTSENIDKSKWPTANEAMKKYKQDIQDALLPTAAFLKTQKTAMKIAGALFALNHFDVVAKVVANTTDFTLDSALKLSQIPFASKGSFSLSSFFGLTGFILYKMEAAEKAGDTLRLPPDLPTLKKWLKEELNVEANKKWLKEHNIQFIDSELDVAAEIITGKKHLKDYIGDKPMLIAENTAEKAMNWFEQKPEDILMNKNLMGLQHFADQLGVMGLEDGQDSSMYKPIIDKIATIKNRLSTRSPLLETDITDLQTALNAINPTISIFTQDGYVYWRKINQEGIVSNYGTLTVDPKLEKTEALAKAFRFVSKNSWEHGLEVVDSKTSELRLLFKELHLEWNESEKIENALLRLMRKGGILVCSGAELTFTYGVQKFFLGPIKMFDHLRKGIFSLASVGEFSAVDMIYDWADGLVPVTVIGAASALSKGDLNMGKVLMKSAIYPVTGTLSVTKNILFPLWKREWKEIIENPRNQFRAGFYERWHSAWDKSRSLYSKIPFTNELHIKVASNSRNLHNLYSALFYIKQGQRSLVSGDTLYKKAENALGTKVLGSLLSNLDSHVGGGQINSIDDDSVKEVLERIELQIKREYEIMKLRKSIMKIPKTDPKYQETIQKITEIEKKSFKDYKSYRAGLPEDTEIPPSNAGDIDGKAGSGKSVSELMKEQNTLEKTLQSTADPLKRKEIERKLLEKTEEIKRALQSSDSSGGIKNTGEVSRKEMIAKYTKELSEETDELMKWASGKGYGTDHPEFLKAKANIEKALNAKYGSLNVKFDDPKKAISELKLLSSAEIEHLDEAKKCELLKKQLQNIQEVENVVQEEVKKRKTAAEAIPDKVQRQAALNAIEEELVRDMGHKKLKGMEFILKEYEKLTDASKGLLKGPIVDYLKDESKVIGKVLRISKGRGIFMLAQVGFTVALEETLKQHEDPDRDIFDFVSKFFDENMQYEALQIFVDILPFAGTYSNFHAAVTGKQLIYQAASSLQGQEIKPAVDVSDTMSRVSNALWGTAGLAGDIMTILSAVPTGMASVPVNLATRLSFLVKSEARGAKIAKVIYEQLPTLTKLASKTEGGWRTVMSKLLGYLSSSKETMMMSARKFQRPLFIGAVTSTVGMMGAGVLGYSAKQEMKLPVDIAQSLDDISKVKTSPTS